MGIDLEALANDLRAAGYHVGPYHRGIQVVRWEDGDPLVRVYGDKEVLWATPRLPLDFSLLAIIARHLGAGQPVAADRAALYRVCGECDGGGIVPNGEPVPGWEHTRKKDCDVCGGEGYVPVAPPEPLSAGETRILRQALIASQSEPVERRLDAVLTALPARFAVPVEGA